MASELVLVTGTRPDRIKMAPVARRLTRRCTIIDSGQHYAEALDSLPRDTQMACRRLQPPPSNASRAAQLGSMTSAFADVFENVRAGAVVVQGDTTTALAASLAANALALPLAHIEAGLRSWDRRMPEEHNRVAIDHLADLCLAPTGGNVRNLIDENISRCRVRLTGNSIIQAVHDHLPSPDMALDCLRRYGLSPNEYVIATFHRPENVDDAETFRTVVSALGSSPFPVVLPLHPRSRSRAVKWALEFPNNVIVMKPLRYTEFLALLGNAMFAISDSGGIQEEVSVLKKRLLVVRVSNERPEVEGTFAKRVAVHDLAHAILANFEGIVDEPFEVNGIASPFGDHTSIHTIARELDMFAQSYIGDTP